MSININKHGSATLLILILLVSIALGALIYSLSFQHTTHIIKGKNTGFAKFSSEEEFVNNVLNQEGNYESPYYTLNFMNAQNSEMLGDVKSAGSLETASTPSSPSTDSSSYRYSETNTQVEGIDEPDIVKTDGKDIYYAPYIYSYWSYGIKRKTLDIKALPANESRVKKTIPKSGEMLLLDGKLIFLSNQKISCYDISEDKTLWELDLNSSYIITARAYNGKIYVVLRKYLNFENHNIVPLKGVIIRPTEIYYPQGNLQLDELYFVFEIDPNTGRIDKRVSFLGPSSDTTIYMSKKNIYVAMSYRKTDYDIIKGFILENKNSLPRSLIDRLKEVEGYDISEYSKLNEMEIALNRYKLTLSDDERLKFNSNFENYFKEHEKELERTRIAKIPLDSLSLDKSTDIEGRLLNQFSMDEFNNNLRVVVTRGIWDNSDNLLYIFDDNLNLISETGKFGTNERVYAVRFIGDKAYVVTYKQIDPLFIMDLSNPKDPKIVGQLNISGYSSYLHPITDELLIGIGREGSSVKVSLFDVSDAEHPKELSRYFLNDYWSEILYNHHAFLLDKKHSIFFIPASKGGHIFSYKNNKLSLAYAVNQQGVKRAVYINDNLYTLSNSNMVVIDENSMKRIKEVDFSDYENY